MNLETFIKQFEESVADIPEGSIQTDTRFKELPTWDSLALLTLSDTIDMEYGVQLSAKDFRAVNTVAELYECVRSRK